MLVLMLSLILFEDYFSLNKNGTIFKERTPQICKRVDEDKNLKRSNQEEFYEKNRTNNS